MHQKEACNEYFGDRVTVNLPLAAAEAFLASPGLNTGDALDKVDIPKIIGLAASGAAAIKKCLPEACGRAGLNKAIKVVKQLKRSGALCGEYEFITVESREGDRVVIML